VEFRLVEENKALSMERSHLSDLMANVQKMHNDIERSSENDRRRLESQIQLLENQRFVVLSKEQVSSYLIARLTSVQPRFTSPAQRGAAKCPTHYFATGG
jgi:uncharacterized protein YdcH (DUF465 family)